MILQAAEIEEPIAWPFEYDLIVKDAATELIYRARRYQSHIGNRRRLPKARFAKHWRVLRWAARILGISERPPHFPIGLQRSLGQA
jgi:hypothetical protein